MDKSYYYLAIQAYFEGVTGFHPHNFIDLLFLRDLIPAYFWIFPGVKGKSNVGLGFPYTDLLGKRISLKKELFRIIKEYPEVSFRFRNATLASDPKARGLAISRKLQELSGDRFLLLGDAALLVDPFTGEGVGNAMASAESAAFIIRDCLHTGDFSAVSLSAYDRRISRRMGMEHSTSAAMQRYARHAWLFNLVVRKANRHKSFKELLASALSNDMVRLKLANPLFYARLFFGR